MKSALIVTQTHAVYGGVESIVSDLSCELPSRGWNVTLGLLRGARYNIPETFLEAHPGLKAVEIDGSSGTTEGRVQALMRAIHQLKPDLLLAARVYDAYEAARRLKREGRNLRFALTIQAYETDYLADLRKWHGQVDYCVTSGKLVLKACEQICGLERNRLVSIPGGVKSASAVPRSHDRPLRLGYAGRLDQDQKRTQDLVKIVQTLLSSGLDFTLSVAGHGPMEGEIRDIFTELLGKKFHFHGWISAPEALTRFYSSIDVFVHTAGHEGVSIAPREAMACGAVPLISEFTGFWTEGHFRPNCNCLSFRVGDTKQAVSGIMTLDADRRLLEKLSEMATNSQTGLYSWSGALDAWASALHDCVSLPCKPALPVSIDSNADPGRLSRWGIPPAVAQFVRNLTGRQMLHATPGAEWPHSGCLPDSDFECVARRLANASEFEAKQIWQNEHPATA
jgi:glycosyltransferase involved in cell wall biosynthesis